MVIIDISLASVALFWGVIAWNLLRWVIRLKPLPPLEEKAKRDFPSVTIIAAARDEALRVQQTVRTQLDQKFVDRRVIIVDDRSTDGTTEILAEWSRTNPELTVLRVEALPAGWLGKTNAMQLASAGATSEWLLFTDADCWLKEDVVARAIAVARKDGVEHICLLPNFATRARGRSFLTQSCHLVFGTFLGEQIAKASADHPRGFGGIGAFNLVRSEAYHRFGGHEQLRLEVVDDPMLGVLIRRGGGRTRGYLAAREIECDWSHSIWGFVKILEKNYFAIFGYRAVLVHFLCAMLLAMWLCGLLGPLTMRPAGIFCGIAFWAMSFPSFIVARRMDWPTAPAILAPLALIVLVIAILNSTWRALWKGGIHWRDTFYTLTELRTSKLNWTPFERFTTHDRTIPEPEPLPIKS